MTEYVRLYPKQTADNAFLFRVEDEDTGNLGLRADLRQEACSKCNKFDEMKALHKKSYNRPVIKGKQDFLASSELFPIVSGRLRRFLDSLVGDAVQYFDLAPNTDYFVALPAHVIRPDAGSTSFRALDKCPKCGRYDELLWGPTLVTMTSEIEIGVFHLENTFGITPIWVVSKDVSTALKKETPKFKGFVMDPLKNVVQVKDAIVP